jgi:Protein of unknown function (DUF3135)
MQNISTSTEFDFEEWVKLAKEDPDAFENKRQQTIQKLIDNSQPKIRKRMQGLQWQIDQIRSAADNPMASCLKISQMMWDSAVGDDGLVDHLQQLTNPNPNKLNKVRRSATIINLKDGLNKEKD